MNINIKKLDPNAVIPQYSKQGDAGMDLTATSIDNTNTNYIEYGTGLAIEIPEGYVGLIFPRSSNSKYDLQLCNSVGVIDSGYRGEIKFRFRRVLPPRNIESTFIDLNNSICDVMEDKIPNIDYLDEGALTIGYTKYKVGDKIGQIIIMPYPQVTFNEVTELSSTERGEGGFGSTGN